MPFEFNGLKEFQKQLKNLSDSAKKNSGTHNVSLNELFNDSFMSKYTRFTNANEFVKESKFDFSDIESIPDEELDIFVSKNTQFSNWSEMLGKASELWTMRKLGL